MEWNGLAGTLSSTVHGKDMEDNLSGKNLLPQVSNFFSVKLPSQV